MLIKVNTFPILLIGVSLNLISILCFPDGTEKVINALQYLSPLQLLFTWETTFQSTLTSIPGKSKSGILIIESFVASRTPV